MTKNRKTILEAPIETELLFEGELFVGARGLHSLLNENGIYYVQPELAKFWAWVFCQLHGFRV